MKYEECVYNEILKYQIGEPIFVADIIKAVAKKTGNAITKIKYIVPVMLNRIIKKQTILLKRYKNGIYYRFTKCMFGDTVIHKEILIEKKYLKKYDGYEIGPDLLNALGLTTLLSNNCRTIVSNLAKKRSFYDTDLNIKLLKPKTLITKENLRYLQLLDVIESVNNKILIDNENPNIVYEKYINFYKLNFDYLFFYAVNFYNKNVINQVSELFKNIKGGEHFAIT